MRSFDRMNRGDCAEWRPLLRPEVPHCARRSLWFGSIRRTDRHYSLITRIRNLSLANLFGVHSGNLWEFDAIIIQNVQPSPAAKVPKLKRQAPDKPQFATCKKTVGTASAFWNLELGVYLAIGVWNLGFPDETPPVGNATRPRRVAVSLRP